MHDERQDGKGSQDTRARTAEAKGRGRRTARARRRRTRPRLLAGPSALASIVGGAREPRRRARGATWARSRAITSTSTLRGSQHTGHSPLASSEPRFALRHCSTSRASRAVCIHRHQRRGLICGRHGGRGPCACTVPPICLPPSIPKPTCPDAPRTCRARAPAPRRAGGPRLHVGPGSAGSTSASAGLRAGPGSAGSTSASVRSKPMAFSCRIAVVTACHGTRP